MTETKKKHSPPRRRKAPEGNRPKPRKASPPELQITDDLGLFKIVEDGKHVHFFIDQRLMLDHIGKYLASRGGSAKGGKHKKERQGIKLAICKELAASPRLSALVLWNRLIRLTELKPYQIEN